MLKEWLLGDGSVVVSSSRKDKTVTLQMATKEFPIGFTDLKPNDVDETQGKIQLRITNAASARIVIEALERVAYALEVEACEADMAAEDGDGHALL